MSDETPHEWDVISAYDIAQELALNEAPVFPGPYPNGFRVVQGTIVEAHVWSDGSVSLRWEGRGIQHYPGYWTFAYNGKGYES